MQQLESISGKQKLFNKFNKFILEDFHPCVMARSVFSGDQVDFKVYKHTDQFKTTQQLLGDLSTYIKRSADSDKQFYSFVATFPNLILASEIAYDTWLWNQLQALHDMDPHPWDDSVSADPESSKFSFSLLGTAFYLVGMHPQSSRMARKAPCTTIIFNLHSQFEQLREMGVYTKVRDRIRKRDKSLQGSMNPMLADFGTNSEARQYSGRAVSEQWKCPFLQSLKVKAA